MASMNLDWLSVGVALVDPTEGHLIQSNKAFRQLLQLDDDTDQSSSSQAAAGDVAVLNFLELLHLDEADLSIECDDEENKEKEKENDEQDTVTRIKEVSVHPGVWLQVQIKTVEHTDDDGDRRLFFLEVSNVTKKVEADQRSLNFLELSFDGFWDWHMKVDYEYMSPRFWHMFGYDPAEKEHKPSEWQKIVFQEDIPAVMAALNEHVASRGAHPFRSECRYRHKDGSTVVVYCNGRVIEWDESDGSPVRMIGTHTDITELRQKQKIATEHRIHEYLSHKVKNPLAGAVGALGFLHSGLQNVRWENEDQFQQAEKDLLTVHHSLMDVSSIIGRLAELHRIHSGEVKFSPTPARVHSQVIVPVLQMCNEHLLGSTIEFEIESDAHLCAVIDVLRVKQVLYGILEGAVARMRKSTDKPRIRVVAQADKDNHKNTSTKKYFCLQVEDSGPAVDTGDDLLLGSASDGVQGSTSGLHPSIYVSRALVQGMSGKFFIDKTAEVGLRIEAHLPGLVSDEEHSEHAEEEKKADFNTLDSIVVDDYYNGARCLVVDDDLIVRKLMVRRLAAIIPGSQIDAVESGEECIRVATQHDFSLFIVDHFMEGPGRPLNGAETICQLRLQGVRAPIIGCSANDVSALHLEAGANSFMSKPPPAKKEQLVQILNSVVPNM